MNTEPLHLQRITSSEYEHIGDDSVAQFSIRFNPLYVFTSGEHKVDHRVSEIARSVRIHSDGRAVWSFYLIGWYAHCNGITGTSGHGFDLEWFKDNIEGSIVINSWDVNPIGWAVHQDNQKFLDKYGIKL